MKYSKGPFSLIIRLMLTILLLNSFSPLRLLGVHQLELCKLKEQPLQLIPLLTSKISNQKNLIASRRNMVLEIRSKIKDSKLDPKGLRSLENQIELNQKIISSFEDKLQCYLHAQTLSQQLLYLPNQKNKKETERINKLILQIDRNTIQFKEVQKKYPSLIIDNEINLFLPQQDCKLEKTSDGKVTANQFVPFFTFTPTDIERHYTEQEFLETYTRLLKSGKKYFVELKFEFSSPKAIQLYGTIEETSPLKLSFIDTDYIYLQNAVTAPPEQQLKTGKIIYKMQCSITKSDLKKLRKKEVDKLTVLWPTGSESYELTHLHVFQNLVACLQQKI